MSIESELAEMLRDHYSSEDAEPFGLAMLGQWLAERGFKRDPGVTLTAWVSRLEPDFVVVTDPLVKARRAIVPPERSPGVLANWTTPASPFSQTKNLLERLPRPLLVAFHLVPENEADRVFVLLKPERSRYEVSAEFPDGDGWIEVDAEFRPEEHTFFGSLDRLTDDQRVALEKRVRGWLQAKGLQEDAVLARRQPSESGRDKRRPTALERLIEAQAPAIRRALLVPADIAAILLKYD